MKNYLNKFAVFVALCTGIALAQGTPQQGSQPSSSSPSATSPAQDQSPSAQQPDQGKNPANAPEQMPKSDQSAPSSDQKSSDQSKLPQSDNAATAAGGGDVASQVQSALQQDPKLASDNITAQVNGKNLELNGTVQSADEKKAAEKIAKDKAGSLKVKNHIKVASSNPAGQDKKDNNPPKQ
jgi:osmotically-inducible protein OsmY